MEYSKFVYLINELIKTKIGFWVVDTKFQLISILIIFSKSYAAWLQPQPNQRIHLVQYKAHLSMLLNMKSAELITFFSSGNWISGQLLACRKRDTALLILGSLFNSFRLRSLSIRVCWENKKYQWVIGLGSF